MSGHSNLPILSIKRKNDAAKGKILQKISKELAVAVKRRWKR